MDNQIVVHSGKGILLRKIKAYASKPLRYGWTLSFAKWKKPLLLGNRQHESTCEPQEKAQLQTRKIIGSGWVGGGG